MAGGIISKIYFYFIYVLTNYCKKRNANSAMLNTQSRAAIKFLKKEDVKADDPTLSILVKVVSLGRKFLENYPSVSVMAPF